MNSSAAASGPWFLIGEEEEGLGISIIYTNEHVLIYI
jgi:hypothetical protein